MSVPVCVESNAWTLQSGAGKGHLGEMRVMGTDSWHLFRSLFIVPLMFEVSLNAQPLKL